MTADVAGLRIPRDQRQSNSSLPMHLVDVLNVTEGVQSISDSSGKFQIQITVCSTVFTRINYRGVYSSFTNLAIYMKSTPPLSSNIGSPGNLPQVRSYIFAS